MRLPTGWVDEPHQCDPPTRVQVGNGVKVGRIWRCPCNREWEVLDIEPLPGNSHIRMVCYGLVRLPSELIPSREQW
jgi:hypothetical protein